ncbi:uncharacterized protein TNCV_2258831 [Trichonephila clavipes]|nr:uncharacterized protein TNCV_2258831 [Trichonephila clavipes]
MASWEYLWPTLRCRREAGVRLLLSIGWWYLSSVSPKRHCCRVSAADKGCWVYPLDPRLDAVVLYSGCTPGQRRAWFVPDDRLTASLVGLRGGWRHARRRCLRVYMDPMLLCPGKSLVLPNLTVDDIARNTRFLILSLPNNDMSKKSPFAIHKALIGIGGEPKSVKHLRSEDLLIETSSALQMKSLLLATSFLDSTLTIIPHKSLNTSRGAISEPDLLSTPEAEILEGFSDQGVIHVRRITIKRDATIIPIKHLILTFNSPKLPSTMKAGYLNYENITKIKCPPLELLKPLSSAPQPNAFPSIPSVSTSSYTTQANILPSATSIKPTTQIESRLPGPIPISAAAPFNNLNTSNSSLSTETCPAPTTSNKFAALQPTYPLLESATTSNRELSNASKVPQNVKMNSKNGRKRTKAQKAELEIKMAKHKRRKSAPMEYTTDDEGMLMYDMEEELEPDSTDKFVLKDCFSNFTRGYLRSLTPTRFRKRRNLFFFLHEMLSSVTLFKTHFFHLSIF